MYPQSAKDAIKKMPVNQKIDLANVLLNVELKKRIGEMEKELKNRLDKLEKDLDERFNKQLDDILDSLLDNLSE